MKVEKKRIYKGFKPFNIIITIETEDDVTKLNEEIEFLEGKDAIFTDEDSVIGIIARIIKKTVGDLK